MTEYKTSGDTAENTFELLRASFHRSADIMVFLAPDGTILDINRVFEKATGGNRSEVIGQKFSESVYLPPDSCDAIRAGLLTLIDDSRSAAPFEIEMQSANDEYVPYEVWGTTIRNEHGELQAVHATLRDISRRKRIQTDLHELQEFLKSVINACPDPIFVKDRYHRWVILNDAFCEFLGRPRETLIGKSDYDIFPKEEADNSWKTDNGVFSSGNPNEITESLTDGSGIAHTITTRKSLFINPVTEAKFLFGIMNGGALKKSETGRWRHIGNTLRQMVK